jgi:HK97 family phage portal protein
VSLFRPQRAVEPRASSPTGNLTELLRRRLPTGAAGVALDTDTLLTHSAVYACSNLIADLVSSCEPYRYTRDADNRLVRRYGASILDNPSTDDDVLNWRRLLLLGWLLEGFTPGLATTNAAGRPVAVELIDQGRVAAHRSRRDDPWIYTVDGRDMERWPAGPLWLAQGRKIYSGHAFGASVLQHARYEAGLGLAARKFGSDFFAAGGQPTVIVRNTDEHVEYDEDGAAEIKQRFIDSQGAGRGPVVLSGAWAVDHFMVNPEDSQFLALIGANRATVASMFNVEPGLIGAPAGTNTLKYQNVEASGIHLVRHTLRPWIRREEIYLGSLVASREAVRLDLEPLKETDILTRNRADDVAIRGGYESVDEVRERRGYAPIEGGDRFLWPPGRSNLTRSELDDSEGTVDLEDEEDPETTPPPEEDDEE